MGVDTNKSSSANYGEQGCVQLPSSEVNYNNRTNLTASERINKCTKTGVALFGFRFTLN